MLKNILYACALSSMITLTAYANEEARDISNTTEQIVVAPGQDQDSSDLFASTVEEAPIVITEENPNEVFTCNVEEKTEVLAFDAEEKTEELACNTEEKTEVLACNPEEKTEVLEEILACCEKEECSENLVMNDDKEVELLAVNVDEETPVVIIEEKSEVVACGKCGRDCNGRHMILATNDTQDESEKTIIKSVEEDVIAA